MQPANTRVLTALKSTITPPPAEVCNDALTREDLLQELRALNIAFAESQRLLDVSRRKAEQFQEMERAYRAALAACAREEQIRKGLERALAALSGPTRD